MELVLVAVVKSNVMVCVLLANVAQETAHALVAEHVMPHINANVQQEKNGEQGLGIVVTAVLWGIILVADVQRKHIGGMDHLAPNVSLARIALGTPMIKR